MSSKSICYAVRISAAWTNRLIDVLRGSLGPDLVLIDVETLEPGVDSVAAIQTALNSCRVLLAVIGPHCPAATDARGRRLLDHPSDSVQLQLATSLRRRIRILVIVGGVVLPHADDLPDELKPLVHQQAQELGDRRWASDTRYLVGVSKDLARKRTKRAARRRLWEDGSDAF